MSCHWFVFCKNDLILELSPDGGATIPFAEEPPFEVEPWTRVISVTLPNGEVVKTFSADTPPVSSSHFILVPLRASYYRLTRWQYLSAGKCAELLYWDHNTLYCGACGGQMKFHTDISKRCQHCGKEVWPQLSTAVICRVTRGDEVLMVRAKNFRGSFYGLVAGFVETGETLEEAVSREVKEETGISITNLRYFGSQPWPYPCGLMVGFTATYQSGTLLLQHSELQAGGWFHRDNLPPLPEKLSIARQLIDDWIV